MQADKLPPLPVAKFLTQLGNDGFSAEQMHEYAAAAAIAEAAEDLRADAMRWRFARDGAPEDGPFIAEHFRKDRSSIRQLTGANADAAIDAALSTVAPVREGE